VPSGPQETAAFELLSGRQYDR